MAVTDTSFRLTALAAKISGSNFSCDKESMLPMGTIVSLNPT